VVEGGELRAGAAVAPAADAAGVDVDEAGAGVVADSSALEGDGGVAQGQRVDTGNANVDGVRLHVEAVSRYAGGASAEKFVAPRGAIAADDVDFGIGSADGSGEIGENVEDVRIVVLDFAGAVIAEKMVELSFGLGQEDVTTAINDINALAGVRVVEAKMMFLGRGIGWRGLIAAVRGSREEKERCCDKKRNG